MSPGLQPLERPPQVAALRRLTLIGVLAALAIIGRVAFLWAPNYALTYFVVFFAGVLLGPLSGIAVGAVSMTATNLLLSGLHPVLLANALAMGSIGALGGILRGLFLVPPVTRLDRVYQWTIAGAAGLFGTFLFSLLGDLMGFLLQFVVTPEGSTVGTTALVPMLLLGLVFNLGPALLNMVLFASATPVLLATLRKSGHVWQEAKPVTDAGTARAWGTAARTPAPGAGTTRPGRP